MGKKYKIRHFGKPMLVHRIQKKTTKEQNGSLIVFLQCCILFLRANSIKNNVVSTVWKLVSAWGERSQLIAHPYSTGKIRSSESKRTGFLSPIIRHKSHLMVKKKKNTLTILQIKVENKINRHWQTEQWFTPAAQHSNIQIQFPDHLPQSDKHTKLQIAILANNDHSTSEQRVAPPVFKGYYTGYVLESHAVHLFISLIRFNTEILEWQTAVNFSKCTTDVAQLLTGSANDH